MHKFVRNLLTEWRKLKLPFDDETILIAVSGGADSAALLLALYDLREAKKLKLNFIVAHYNHKLRGKDSDTDEKFVKELAKKLKIKFISSSRKPNAKSQKSKDNLEQSARQSRYEFLEQSAEKFHAFAVLTAHTANDQAETLLLNLLRGSGIAGLSAMKTARKISENSEVLLVRPLLAWAKREQTESFAREKKIEFRRDSMNEDENFSRVRLRKKIIPSLKEFNPKIVETLVQTAFLLQKDAEQLSVTGYQLSANPSVKNLHRLSKSTLYGFLREWLKMMRGDLRGIEMNRIEAVEQLIFSNKSGRKVELPNGEAIIKKRGNLIFEKTKVEKS